MSLARLVTRPPAGLGEGLVAGEWSCQLDADTLSHGAAGLGQLHSAGRGRRKLVLGSRVTGVRSSRLVAQALLENAAFRVLSSNQTPQEKNRHLFRFDMAVHNLMKVIRQLQRALAPAKAPRNSTNHPAPGARAAIATA